MYNLMQLDYVFKNPSFLRVLLPTMVFDTDTFNEVLKQGLKEAYIVIPSMNGLVIHFNNVQFHSSIKTINDVKCVTNTDYFLEIKPENIYLETNGVQILDNNGMLLFKKDVEKYICETYKSPINFLIHDNFLLLAVYIGDSQKNNNIKSATNSVDDVVKHCCTTSEANCKTCIDRMVGINTSTQRSRLNRSHSPFRSRVGG